MGEKTDAPANAPHPRSNDTRFVWITPDITVLVNDTVESGTVG